MSTSSSIVADPKLAPEGARKIAWVAQHAPVLNLAFERRLCDGSLRGVNVAVCVPLEAKTAYLSILLHRAGANVALAGTAPGYVQDDVAAAVALEGVTVFAAADASAAEFEDYLIGTVRTDPALLVDDRAELTRILHTKETARLPKVWGASEQTTSGVTKLVNNGARRDPEVSRHRRQRRDVQAPLRQPLRHGPVGLHGDPRADEPLSRRQDRRDAGYGWLGKGLAPAPRDTSLVVVCEVDPRASARGGVRRFLGMPCGRRRRGETSSSPRRGRTRCSAKHIERMKDGAVLSNAGGPRHRIDVPAARSDGLRESRGAPPDHEYRMPDGRAAPPPRGRALVNIAGSDGHPVEIMDLSFTVQALAINHIGRRRGELAPEFIRCRRRSTGTSPAMKLESLGIAIDTLTSEQTEMRTRWQ